MVQNDKNKSSSSGLYRNTAIGIFIWLILTGTSLVWDITNERNATLEHAKNEARAYFNKDLALRLWATSHGGVYVPPDDRTPPNPYLTHVPDRDVQTTSGKNLTLMNPAYILRQAMEEYEKLFGIKGHITSLKVLNPINAPDEWERNALLSFQQGASEVSEIADINKKAYLRMMQPMVTQKKCLKCHEHQGYKEGDIRGGIGVSVPMTSYILIRNQKIRAYIWTHGIIFLVGLLAIGFVTYRSGLRTAERLQAEKELKESENRFRAFMENNPAHIYIKDQDGHHIYANKSLLNLAGKKQEEFLGTSSYDLFPKEIAEQLEEYDDLVRTKKDIITVPDLSIEKNGRTITLKDIKFPIQTSDGNVLVGGISLDITDQKQAEEERIQLSTAIEQADETIMITDNNGTIQYVNPAFTSITGYTREEMIGRNKGILKSGIQDDTFYKKLWDTISKGDVWKGHFVNKKKDGSLYEEDSTISPVKNTAGEITNYVAVKRDVTNELKLAQQLRQTQKIEAIGTLAGGIAHDFNNILAIIIACTELSLEDVSGMPETHQTMNQVLGAAGRAKDLVQQILTFSRQTEKEKRPVKTAPIVKEVCKFLRSSLPTTIEIQQNITTESDLIMGEPTQFHQIIMNLCTNAGYAMKDQGGILEVLLEDVSLTEDDMVSFHDMECGDYLKLTVIDTGDGISKGTIDRIFDPYFTTKEQGEGTGLGLAVVHGIVKNLGGEIKVYSEVGKGTSFHVYLPLMDRFEAPNAQNEDDIIPTGNERILLIDDEEMLLNAGKQILQRLGYTVVAVSNAAEALDTFKLGKDLYDLVITDKTMPSKTGFELAQEIKKIRPDIPVILCTGFSTKTDEEKSRAVGIDRIITKPIHKRTIAETVREVLNNR